MDKLLHVQVAEALGWTEVQGKDHIGWYGRSPERQYGLDGHGISPLPHFDTDWSATGPLIERYRLELCGPSRIAPKLWSAAYESLDYPPYQAYVEAEAPLIAICHLILALHAAGKL